MLQAQAELAIDPPYTPAAPDDRDGIPEFDSDPLKTEATMLPDAKNFATDGIFVVATSGEVTASCMSTRTPTLVLSSDNPFRG